MQRQSFIVLVLALAAGACGPKKDIQKPDGDGVCPTDAKECPDGTSLQRTGENCEFPACPGEGEEAKDAADGAGEPAADDPASDAEKTGEEKPDGETPPSDPPA